MWVGVDTLGTSGESDNAGQTISSWDAIGGGTFCNLKSVIKILSIHSVKEILKEKHL